MAMLPCLPTAPNRGLIPRHLHHFLKASHQNWTPLSQMMYLGLAPAGGAPILRADAYPALGSIFVWRTVVETDGRWITARIRPLARGAPPRQESAPRQTSVWIERARELPDVRGYAWFAMGVVRATEADRDGQHVVEFHDMRYGPRPESIDSMWPLQVTFDKQGRPLSAETHPPTAASNRWRILKETWSDLWEP